MGSTRRNSPPISVLILMLLALVLFWDQRHLQRQEELRNDLERNPLLTVFQGKSDQDDEQPGGMANPISPVSIGTEKSKNSVKDAARTRHSAGLLNHKHHKSKWSLLGKQG